jgi:protein phosphatase
VRLHDDTAIVANAGDTRVYLVRRGRGLQITEDHTLYDQLLAAGVDGMPARRDNRFGSLLTSYLGCETGRFCFRRVHLLPGDRLLVCSDGVSGYLDLAEMVEVAAELSPEAAAEELTVRALAAGGTDNATAVVIAGFEGERPSGWHRLMGPSPSDAR